MISNQISLTSAALPVTYFESSQQRVGGSALTKDSLASPKSSSLSTLNLDGRSSRSFSGAQAGSLPLETGDKLVPEKPLPPIRSGLIDSPIPPAQQAFASVAEINNFQPGPVPVPTAQNTNSANHIGFNANANEAPNNASSQAHASAHFQPNQSTQGQTQGAAVKQENCQEPVMNLALLQSTAMNHVLRQEAAIGQGLLQGAALGAGLIQRAQAEQAFIQSGVMANAPLQAAAIGQGIAQKAALGEFLIQRAQTTQALLQSGVVRQALIQEAAAALLQRN